MLYLLGGILRVVLHHAVAADVSHGDKSSPESVVVGLMGHPAVSLGAPISAAEHSAALNYSLVHGGMKIRLVLDREQTHLNVRNAGFGQHPHAVFAVRFNGFNAVIKHTGVGSEALHAVELILFALVYAPKSLVCAYPQHIFIVNAKAGDIAGRYELRQALLLAFAELSLRQSRKLRRLFGSVFSFVPSRDAHKTR